jgi:hypothetical protein
MFPRAVFVQSSGCRDSTIPELLAAQKSGHNPGRMFFISCQWGFK